MLTQRALPRRFVVANRFQFSRQRQTSSSSCRMVLGRPESLLFPHDELQSSRSDAGLSHHWAVSRLNRRPAPSGSCGRRHYRRLYRRGGTRPAPRRGPFPSLPTESAAQQQATSPIQRYDSTSRITIPQHATDVLWRDCQIRLAPQPGLHPYLHRRPCCVSSAADDAITRSRGRPRRNQPDIPPAHPRLLPPDPSCTALLPPTWHATIGSRQRTVRQLRTSSGHHGSLPTNHLRSRPLAPPFPRALGQQLRSPSPSPALQSTARRLSSTCRAGETLRTRRRPHSKATKARIKKPRRPQ